MGHRTLIIGDIHGMLSELDALLHQLNLRPEDRVVFVGDLVDKGPESPGVVRRVRELAEQFGVVLVKGNHEDKHERFRRKPRENGGEVADIVRALGREDVRFLETAVLYHRLPEHGALDAHAGLVPGMDLPSLEELEGLSKNKRSRFEKVMRVRRVRGRQALEKEVKLYEAGGRCVGKTKISEGEEFPAPPEGGRVDVKEIVRPKGEFLPLGTATSEDPYWADVYDGRFGHVFFGHEPFFEDEEPRRFPYATGIDLGAVFGGRLAAAVLSAEGTAFVSVPASGRFADPREDDE